MLTAETLRFAFPDGRVLLDGVGFSLRPGVPLVLLGPNGTGKTTLLRCLLGLERLSGGRVLVEGRDLAGLGSAEAARAMAYVPQASEATFAFRAFDIVLMGRNPHLGFMAGPGAADRAAAEAAMARLGISALAGRAFNELSGGERQLVLVARALAQGSRVLVMDEPCASLDLGNQMRILGVVRALADAGYGILLTTHHPDHAFLLEGEVGLLQDGRMLGPAAPAALLRAETLEALYGTPIEVMAVDAGRARGQTLCVPVLSR